MAKIKPGLSLKVNAWIAGFAIIVILFLANYTFKSNPDFATAYDMSQTLRERLNIERVSILIRGKPTAPSIEKTLQATLFHNPKRNANGQDRDELVKKSFVYLAYEGKLRAGTITIITKVQVGGGCQPTYKLTSRNDFNNPLFKKPPAKKKGNSLAE